MELTEVVLPVFFVSRLDEKTHIGTCFIIGAMGKHAIAISAAHVLEEAIKRSHKHINRVKVAPTLFEDVLRKSIDSDDDVKVIISNKEWNIVCNVDKAWGNPDSDLAVLLIDIPKNIEYSCSQCLKIDSSGVQLKDKIEAIGYYDCVNTESGAMTSKMEALKTRLPNDVNEIAKVYKETGEVVEVFEKRHIFIKTPCFRVNIPFHSCMSGGPVIKKINNELYVCGVISSDNSSDGEQKYGDGTSAVVSILAPILEHDLVYEPTLEYCVELEDGTTNMKKIYSLNDFVKLNVITDISSN